MMREIDGAYVADHVFISGDVTLGAAASIWPFCSIRGDVAPITVGPRCSVQDGAVLHCAAGVPLVVEDEVVIGHQAVVHCARVGRRSLIGIGARVLDNCEIGQGCIVAAGAVVAPGTKIPDDQLVMGVPGRIARTVREDEHRYIDEIIRHYVELAAKYLAGTIKAVSRK